jgi:hypothetical protein
LYASLVSTLTKEEQEQAEMSMKIGFEKYNEASKR